MWGDEREQNPMIVAETAQLSLFGLLPLG